MMLLVVQVEQNNRQYVYIYIFILLPIDHTSSMNNDEMEDA